jgi:hypothetical protein
VKALPFVFVLLFAFASLAADAPSNAIYANDFERAPTDKIPEELMVMSGTFVVKEEGGNKFLELPGAPLDTFGLLFGPPAQTGVAAGARFFGTKQGRKFPTFGVSLNGVAGYRLQMSPAKKALEIYKGDEPKASVPFEWQSGAWTSLRIRIRATDNGWIVEGKAWLYEAVEPQKWAIAFPTKEEPPPGRAGIWGSPYAGTPIQFDDLVMTKEK